MRRMLASHIHCGQEMELIVVHPVLPGQKTSAGNRRTLLTYRCTCGFSFDQQT